MSRLWLSLAVLTTGLLVSASCVALGGDDGEDEEAPPEIGLTLLVENLTTADMEFKLRVNSGFRNEGNPYLVGPNDTLLLEVVVPCAEQVELVEIVYSDLFVSSDVKLIQAETNFFPSSSGTTTTAPATSPAVIEGTFRCGSTLAVQALEAGGLNIAALERIPGGGALVTPTPRVRRTFDIPTPTR